MKVRILDAEVEYVRQRMITPLVLSTGSITELTEAQASVRVELDGREAVGRGSIYLSDLWAWPPATPDLSHDEKEQVLKRLCDEIASRLPDYTGNEFAHPLELGMRLYDGVCHARDESFANVPVLARAMCLSPFDAAIHDAAGIALNRSAFDFYDQPDAIPSVDELFPDGGACRSIAKTFLTPPRDHFPAWLIVGKNDVLARDVRPWAVERGYRCFKLKIMGRDATTDVGRTVELFRALNEWGVRDPWLSVDSNEANPDADSVLEYLHQLRARDAGAYQALQYLEQPTGRDIRQHRHDWREVSKLKPVMLDEGLTDLDLLPEAMDQGWSGLALKSCKGHSFTLVAAAWAREHGMRISLQDLTNAGYSMIHAALLAANLPTINGVELNSPQFTPAANEPWLPRLATLFTPINGTHRVPETRPVGLGSRL